ncbi:MAG: diguanylate cyclase, partial [Gemmatimonadales bacterium]
MNDSHVVIVPELQALLDASPDAVLIVDQAGRIVALNRRVESLFATTADRLRGAAVETLVPGRAREAHASARRAYASAPTVRAMSTRRGLMGLRADGTEFPVEVSLTPVIGSAEGLVMAVVHDVALRAPVEAAILGTSRAADAVDAIADAILTADADGNVDFLNRSAEVLTGRTRDEARGHPLREVLPLIGGGRDEPLASPLAACLRQGIPGSCDGVLATRGGQDSRVLDLSTAPLRDASGAITGAVVIARDVTHARLIERKLTHQATHDALTGLVNRDEFERRLARALGSVAGGRGEHAVCFLDLDGFKRVNDACGHSAGDELLRQLSELMRDRMRSRDTLARLGGDEFGLLLEHCRLPRAQRIAEGIRKAIADYRFTFGPETYGVAASIGIVPVRAAAGQPSDVVRAADAACYLAKRGGGNRIQVSVSHRQPADDPRGQAWSRRVISAVEENRFRLYAQPLTPLGHGDCRAPGFELLLRLDEGGDEPLAPHSFLPGARRQGLMPAIDRWVVREALQQMAGWRRAHPGAEEVILAINLDDESVIAGTTLAFVREALATAAVPPHTLCFEISASVVAAHPAASATFLRDLRGAGCQTTLEHCGSNMAAFTLLRR